MGIRTRDLWGLIDCSQFHVVEHIVLNTINLVAPALVEMAVEPIPEGMVSCKETSTDVIHHLTLLSHIMV